MTGGSDGDTAGKHLGLALAVISAAQLMIVLDATIVNVAFPPSRTSLHFSTANLEWLITAYALTFGGLLLFGGRTGDLFGKRRMFMIGIAVFVPRRCWVAWPPARLGSSSTRGLQGVGAAIAAPTALSLIATNFPEGQPRNRALGCTQRCPGAAGRSGCCWVGS